MKSSESQNCYPSHALLALEALPSSEQTTAAEPEDLDLTLKLEPQWSSLLSGKICWGLKKVNLTIRAINCSMTFQSFAPPHLSVKLAAHSLDFSTWQLTPDEAGSLLQANCQSLKIATLRGSERPSQVIATLDTELGDISITDADDLWPHDISPNQLSIIKCAIAKFLQTEAFIPHLSWNRLSSESITDNSSPQNALRPQSLNRLEILLTKVCQAETENLIELAELVKLDPKSELVGGNFLAGQLNGMACNSFDFSWASFRGADLTDIDLSEANLYRTQFRGADLSGAYLGNANLEKADLRRSSLALANLIGANLQQANLTEANLNQVNFSGAVVTDTKFSDNADLSEEQKADLKQRGAIFVSS